MSPHVYIDKNRFVSFEGIDKDFEKKFSEKKTIIEKIKNMIKSIFIRK